MKEAMTEAKPKNMKPLAHDIKAILAALANPKVEVFDRNGMTGCRVRICAAKTEIGPKSGRTLVYVQEASGLGAWWTPNELTTSTK